MSTTILGTLEPVDLRQAWANEANDFTPWLASDVGLKLLGATLGFELQLSKVEQNVGAFSADILAKRMDTGDDHWVLVENQLARTDHGHLGQLLTYAAGLKAATIIWIASEVRQEHRAALDWLNEITAKEFEFYGLEMELWRIGGSMPAPKFNIVCRPNDWQRAIKTHAASGSTAASDLKLLQLEYWTALHEKLAQPGHQVKPQKPQPQNWAYYRLGRWGAQLCATINSMADELAVSCDIKEPFDKSAFHQLFTQKDAIEAEMGAPLDWRELPNKKSSRILLFKKGTDPEQRDDWPAQHAWLMDTLDRFAKVFRPRVMALSAPSAAPLLSGSEAEEGAPPE
jgi:hypothetical protein